MPYLLEGDYLNEKERVDFQRISADMENYLAAGSLNMLSEYLLRYYGKSVFSSILFYALDRG